MGELDAPDTLDSVEALEEASTPGLPWTQNIEMKSCGFRQESLETHSSPSVRHSLSQEHLDAEGPSPPRNALFYWKWALGLSSGRKPQIDSLCLDSKFLKTCHISQCGRGPEQSLPGIFVEL